MASDPYRYFRVEARELLGRLGQGVLDLETKTPTAQVIQELLRHAHTLKGAARVVKQPAIAEGAHAVEDALAPFRGGGVPAKRPDIDGLLAHLDRMTQLVTELVASTETGPAKAPGRPAEDLVPELSTDPAEVDALVNGISGALAQIGTLRRMLGVAGGGHESLDREVGPLGDPRPRPPSGAPAAPSLYRREGGRDVPSYLDEIERELGQARDAAVGLRLVKASAVFGPLQRIARDTAQALGKEVLFTAGGEDLRLEAHVQRDVLDGLVQVVRNAIAHGIEDEHGRRAAGKPLQGTVRLEVVRRGDRVAFVCRDDGQGLDLVGVRRAAEAKGLLPSSSDGATAEELIGILLRGGLSTSAAVTEVSGRGVGLDVVRAAMARVGGEVTLRSERSVGTTVELIVPMTLSAFDALLVRCGTTVVALPLEAVRRTARVTKEQFARSATGTSIALSGELLPFAPLSHCLRMEPGADAARAAWTTVILSDGSSEAAIGVERLVGTARVVVRKLPATAPVDSVVTGVSFDVEGNLLLVLDPRSLVLAAARASPAAEAQPLARPPILIVDDSLTTRMLEQSILESAGYEVDLAVSGEDALEKAGRRRYGLFLVDVEMPGMDGFGLIGRIRSEPSLRDTPALLVTSRDSPADRKRGERVGANGLISKHMFDQIELLGRIKDLIG